jgi:hypothetical protein
MTTKTIKISEENYQKLVEYAGELQRTEGSPVSLDKALAKLEKPSRKKTMLDLAELKDDKEFIKSLEWAYRTSRKDGGRKIPW